MASLTLGDLFAQRHNGKMTFAENPNGQIVAIDGVPNGLNCNCKCPACGTKLVAKNNGKVNDKHFAHHSEVTAGTCESAGETALHKIAKEYLSTRLELRLPELKVADGKDVESISGGVFQFHAATLEKVVSQIIPDVVVTLKNGRKLIVEFKVTHACDENKIAKIASMKVGAIEVDLSQYRDMPISGLADIILHTAPRKWLYSPKTTELIARIEKKKASRLEWKQHQAKDIIDLATRPLSKSQEAISTYEERWKSRKFSAQFQGLDLVAEGCFRVRSIEWQSVLFEHVFQNPTKRFSADDLLNFLVERGIVDGKLNCTDSEVLVLVHQQIEFVHPSTIIWDFLSKSASFDKLQSASGASRIWQLSLALKNEIKKREIADSRRAELKQIVEKILNVLPNEEVREFNFEKWLAIPIANTDCYFEQAFLFEEANWKKLIQKFQELSSNNWPSQHSTHYLFGLPLERELHRRLTLQKEESECKKYAESVTRTEKLKELAEEDLAEKAAEFLHSPIGSLEGMSPIDAATKDNMGFEKAKLALSHHSQNLRDKKVAMDRHLKQKQLLFESASAYCNDKAFADFWCKSFNKELGWQRPYEYCTDVKRRSEVEALFKISLKKKRNYLTQ